jgi:hypothetical protein
MVSSLGYVGFLRSVCPETTDGRARLISFPESPVQAENAVCGGSVPNRNPVRLKHKVRTVRGLSIPTAELGFLRARRAGLGG